MSEIIRGIKIIKVPRHCSVLDTCLALPGSNAATRCTFLFFLQCFTWEGNFSDRIGAIRKRELEVRDAACAKCGLFYPAVNLNAARPWFVCC